MASSRRMRGAFDSESPAHCPSAARRENRVPSGRRLFWKLDTRNKPSTRESPSGRWNNRPAVTDLSSHTRFFRCRMDPTEPVFLAKYPPFGRFLQAPSARETRKEPQGRRRTRHTQESDSSFPPNLIRAPSIVNSKSPEPAGAMTDHFEALSPIRSSAPRLPESGLPGARRQRAKSCQPA
jgi:hypothetical protein